MTKVFILTFKETGARHSYTSLTALCLLHTQEQLGISKSTLDRFEFDIANYVNEKVIIEKFNALSTAEARNLKDYIV